MTVPRLVLVGLLFAAAAVGVAPTVRAQSSGSTARKAAAMTTIRIEAGSRHWTARMQDNPTARDFLSLLPLTLTLSDYAATEKISDLPRKLSQEGAPAGATPKVGDIALYAPWGNLAIYHKDFRYSPGLIILGRIEADVAALAAKGPLAVTIRRAGEGP